MNASILNRGAWRRMWGGVRRGAGVGGGGGGGGKGGVIVGSRLV